MKLNKFKSLAILCFMLMIFAGISCVSAEDINETSPDIVLEDEGDVLGMMPEDGDFYYVQEKIDNAESGAKILLSRDYTGSGEAITVDKSLTIDGNGHTLDAKGLSHVFAVEADNVIVRNVKFLNGGSSDGGAIKWNGNSGKLENCIFEKCNSNEGSAIYWTGGLGNINGCTFNECFGDGGCIAWDVADEDSYDGHSQIINCKFIDNGCRAIDVLSSCSHLYEISACSFIRNTDETCGGAIYNDGTITKITNSNFDGNTAEYYSGETGGGAIRNYGDINEISNNNFTNHYAYWGGVIENSGNIGTITNNKFISNRAEYGGAIDNWGDASISKITNNYFKDNSAGDGAVINNIDDAVIGELSGNKLQNNVADCGSEIANDATIRIQKDNMQSDGIYRNTYFTTNSPSVKAYPNSATFTFVLKNSDGIPVANADVSYTHNGKTVNTKTDSDGAVSFTISPTKAGSYKITGKFLGDKYNNASSFSKTLTVSKNAVKFSSPTKQVVYSTSKRTFKIALKTSDNKALKSKSVTLTINGKSYKVKTDSKGIATFKVNLPNKKKSYNYKVKFAGDSANSAKTYSGKLVVDKFKVKFTNPTTTIMYHAVTKKYVSFYLKDNQNNALKNKKVTLTFNKKKYTAKSDSSGYVEFGVTIPLKDATVKYTVKYNGDSQHYKKSYTGKVKLSYTNLICYYVFGYPVYI
ncbi:hypothetical protein [Methanobrevibacter sp.]